MQTTQPTYFAAYRSVKMTRDAQGVLVVEFHTNGGPVTFTAQDHTDFVEAFYQIAQDRANKIVILTGTGGEFIPGIDFSSFGNVAEPGVWSQVHDEGVQILENLANIRVPVIAAIEGRAYVHSEYALLADVIVAGLAQADEQREGLYAQLSSLAPLGRMGSPKQPPSWHPTMRVTWQVLSSLWSAERRKSEMDQGYLEDFANGLS